jgi:uncharacterized protein
MIARWLAAVCVAFVCAVTPVHAAPDYPAFTGLVVDDAHVLSPDDRVALTQKLEDLQRKTGVQFAVATVPSLGGLEIEPYANALFRKWGVGREGANNGLLLILAPNERKLRFEVGYGLEGTMTDAQSKLILRNSMVPKLRADDPAGALKAGVDDAIAVLTGKDAALPQSQPQKADDTGVVLFFVIFIGVIVFIVVVFVVVIRRARKGGGWTSTKGSGWVAAPSSSDSSIFGGGSSGSSDSFSGGGGGDSGGGGASDSY